MSLSYLCSVKQNDSDLWLFATTHSGGSQLGKIGFLTGAQIFSNWGVKMIFSILQL
jgi:hypothetical protein